MNEAQRRGRRTLILISLLFATPIAIAMYLYFSGSTLIPVTSTEHGELISPPIQLPDTTLDSEAQFRKIWSLTVFAADACDAVCNEALVSIRQIRLSLGPKMTRMQTVFVPATQAATAQVDIAAHPKLIVATPDSSAAVAAAAGEYRNGEIFLVDPLGNMMMRYEPGTDMGDIRKDIAHLFKLSGIG